MQRYTTMTPTQFKRVRDGWIDGTLAAKWKDNKPTTKSEQVEERQIRAIGMILMENDPAFTNALIKMDWDLLEVLKRDDGKIETHLNYTTRQSDKHNTLYSNRF